VRELGSGRRRRFPRKLLRRVGRSPGGHDGCDDLAWCSRRFTDRGAIVARQECYSRRAHDLIAGSVAVEH